MQPIEVGTGVGRVQVYVTNGGAHSVETMTEMSMSTLCDKDSNPTKMAEMRAQIQDLYAQANKTIHYMFRLVADEKNIENRKLLKASIVEILTRDFNTLLDTENKLFKE
jgi:hypothetical protein